MRFAALLVVCVLAATLEGDVSARPAKGSGPTAIAVGFGSVWVGMGSGEVVRIDAYSARETGRLEGSWADYVHSLVSAYGAVWAVRGSVVRIDPGTASLREVPNTVSATTFVGAAGAGAFWVADDGRNAVFRIDPRKMRRTATIAVPGRAFGVAARARDVLVVSVPTSGPITGPDGIRLIRRLDPRTNRVSRPLVRLRCDPSIAIGRDAVWTTDPCAGSLVRRDRRTLRPTSRRNVPRWLSPVLGFGSVWLVGGDRILRIDPRTLRVVASIPVRGTAAAAGSGALWVLALGDGTSGAVTKIDPRTNRVAGRPIRVVPKS